MSYRVGYKMQALRAHIEMCVGKQIAQRMDAEMSNVELILTPRHMGNGIEICQQRYVAEFQIDRLPFKKYDPAVLFANVAAWLMDNDADREDQLGELKDPEIEVVLEDESNAEVLIQVAFEEPIKLVESEVGNVFWRNKRWSIEEVPVWIAENLLDVSANVRD
ncbi:MAG: phage tail protein [Vibrio sp.]|uniref:phage tail protein n=1 Tax=Vibrio sp. TaxID=678 RepID=UPI003F3BD638